MSVHSPSLSHLSVCFCIQGIVSVHSSSRIKDDDRNHLESSLVSNHAFRHNPFHILSSSYPSLPSSSSPSQLFYSPSTKSWTSKRLNKDSSGIMDQESMMIPSPKVDQKRGKTTEVEGEEYGEKEDSKDEGRKEGKKDSSLEGKQMTNFFPEEEEGKGSGRGGGKNSKGEEEMRGKVAEETREDLVERKKKRNPSSSGLYPHISNSIPVEEAVMEAISYQNRDTVDVHSHSDDGGNGDDGIGVVGKKQLDRDEGFWNTMARSSLETNEIEKNPLPLVARNCCPSVRTQIHPKGGVSRNGVILELYNQDNHTQTFWQISCRETKYSPHCRYLDPRLRPFSSCVQQYSYTYALVREFNAGENAPWRLDYILIRSGCACEIKAPLHVIQNHLRDFPPLALEGERRNSLSTPFTLNPDFQPDNNLSPGSPSRVNQMKDLLLEN